MMRFTLGLLSLADLYHWRDVVEAEAKYNSECLSFLALIYLAIKERLE